MTLRYATGGLLLGALLMFSSPASADVRIGFGVTLGGGHWNPRPGPYRSNWGYSSWSRWGNPYYYYGPSYNRTRYYRPSYYRPSTNYYSYSSYYYRDSDRRSYSPRSHYSGRGHNSRSPRVYVSRHRR